MKNTTFYRVSGPMQQPPFRPTEPSEAMSRGFIPNAILVETRTVPADVAKREAARLKISRADAESQLLPRAFPKRKKIPYVQIGDVLVFGDAKPEHVDLFGFEHYEQIRLRVDLDLWLREPPGLLEHTGVFALADSDGVITYKNVGVETRPGMRCTALGLKCADASFVVGLDNALRSIKFATKGDNLWLEGRILIDAIGQLGITP